MAFANDRSMANFLIEVFENRINWWRYEGIVLFVISSYEHLFWIQIMFDFEYNTVQGGFLI